MKLNKKYLALGCITLLGLIVLFVGVFLASQKIIEIADKGKASQNNNKNNSKDSNSSKGINKNDDEGNPPVGEGTDLIGAQTDLIESAKSLRSLEGLLVQVNQIDICKSPDIEVYANLTKADGSPVTDLRKSDFDVYENDIKVEDFEFKELSSNEIPMSVTLVIDKSGSMVGAPIERAKAAANDFISKLKTDDQVSIMEFSDNVTTVLDFTTDKAAAQNAVNAINAVGSTSLYDAVGKSGETAPACGRRAVILLSDGEDTASKTYNLENAINAANVKNVPIYVVGLVGIDWNPTALQQISSNTGAQYFEAPTPDDLNKLYDSINNQLRAQHLFIYETTLPSGDKRVKIVANKDGANTQSEKSYRE